jgi:DNA-binding winged helix-turn-helix (wHTH) protein
MTPMTTLAARTREIISFGPFSVVACELLLTSDGTPVGLSTRAFYILVTLLSRPNEVSGKSNLMNQVWLGITVEEGSLRSHIVNLRKVLGDGKNSAHYITTASGRCYCFVVRISWGEQRGPQSLPDADFRLAYLPFRLLRMIEREDELQKLIALCTPSAWSRLSAPEVSARQR